ncbi:MAG TPA: peptidase domain-containing ABC transporter [Allosphingosinicella sp.]|jgi:ATP-binding cassette subfamily B protein RaxB
MPKLELVRQTEVTECGLACLAMLACFHGHDVNLAGLRARFGTSSRGVTLRTVIKIASELGLASRAVRVGLEALKHVHLPAMIHWDLDHFVVLESVTKDSVVVFDPATGVRRYSYAEASGRFTGIALEVSPVEDHSPIKETAPRLKLRDLARGIPTFWGAVGQVAALTLLLQLIYLAPPIVIQNVVDKALPSSDLGLLGILGLAYAFVLGLAVICDALNAWVSLQFGQSIAYSTMRRIFAHMLRLPVQWFESRGTGDVLAKVQSHRPIQELFITTIPLMLSDAVVVATTGIVITFYSLTLSLIVFGFLAATALVTILFYPRLVKREEEAIAASIAEHGYLVDTLRSIRVIRSFGAEPEREAVWHNQFANVVNTGVRSGKLRIYLRATQGLLNAVQTVLVVFLAARMIMTDPAFTVGMLIAFLFFRQSLVDKANSLIQRITTLHLSKLHLERLSDILLAEPEPRLAGQSSGPDDDVKGEIQLTNVWMRYGPEDRPVVREATLRIEAGEFVAIVGPTGGGKSSLVKLMAGLAEHYSGEILVDGIPIEQRGRASWREHVAIVAQDDTLMSGTVADNISFFDPDLDMDKVKRAATMAAVATDIDRMPMRYWTWVGDMGSALSGGQRQRILLARALYHEPRILFLDEGTANLDTDTEKRIVGTIAELDMTRIVITHRPALVQRAHRVLTVVDGIVSQIAGDSMKLAEEMAQSTPAPNTGLNRFITPPVLRNAS